MPDVLAPVLFVLLIAAVAVAVGIGFGIVLAPRIGRAADRMDAEEEKPGDRPDD